MEWGALNGITREDAFPRWLGSQAAIGQTVGNPLYDGCVVVLNHNMPSGIGLGVGSTAPTPWTTVVIGATASATKGYAIAIGYGAASSSVTGAIAIGLRARAKATRSIAIGTTSLVTTGTGYGIAIGATARAKSNTVAIGRSAQAYTGTNSVAIGHSASAHGQSVVIGATGKVTAVTAISIGYSAASKGAGSVAIGATTTTKTNAHVVVIGQAAKVTTSIATTGEYAAVFGYKTSASAKGAFAIGCNSLGTGASSATANLGVLGTATHTISHPGGFQTHTVTKTSNYTMAKTDRCVLGTGTITVKVPAPVTGLECFIKNLGSGTVTVKKHTTAKIDGHTTIALSTQYESVHLIATASQWYIVSQAATSIL